MSNLVIVAIPDENDRVWKISSEKIPHLTLLFLGDADKINHLDMIVQYVQHAADTVLGRFSLPIDRRGKLGEDEADVLYFSRSFGLKEIWDFRSMLLKDQNIKTAHDSVEQLDGPWLPHLTLGYPETPAKEDTSDFPPYDVGFTKIAVWDRDFEGPEFVLKDWWDQFEVAPGFDVAHSDPLDLGKFYLEHVGVKGMRWDTDGMIVDFDVREPDMKQAAEVGLEFLEHHGVKGMRWGVTRETAGSVGRAAGSTAGKVGSATRKASTFVKDVQFENKVADGRARQEVIGKAHGPFKKQDLPALKAKHIEGGKLKTRVLKPRSPEAKAYRADVREAYIKRLEEAANATTNASGTRQYTIRERGVDLPEQGGALPKSKVFWDVSSRNVKHADNGDVSTVEVIFDNDGWIVDLKPVKTEDSVTQSVELGAEFLAHYGVAGMRWGHRRAAPEAVAPTATSRVPAGDRRKTKIEVAGGQNHPAHTDAIKVAEAKAKLKNSGTASLSNNELREVATRLQLEAQVKQLTTNSGQKFVTNLLRNQGNQQANQFVSTQVRKKIAS